MRPEVDVSVELLSDAGGPQRTGGVAWPVHTEPGGRRIAEKRELQVRTEVGGGLVATIAARGRRFGQGNRAASQGCLAVEQPHRQRADHPNAATAKRRGEDDLPRSATGFDRGGRFLFD